MATDLASIPGLLPEHLAVLTGPLRITTARELAAADRRLIAAAMLRLRPAPALETISGWQDQARDLAGPPPVPPDQSLAGPGGWEQVAAFVVSFERRQAGTDADRRIVAEQVEQPPPEPRQEWPGWPGEAAWTWMLALAGTRTAGPQRPAAGRGLLA